MRAVTYDLHGSAVATGRAAPVATGRAGGLAVACGVLLPALVVGGGVAGRQLVADGGVVAVLGRVRDRLVGLFVARSRAVASGDLVRLLVLEAAVRVGVAAVRVSVASVRAAL